MAAYGAAGAAGGFVSGAGFAGLSGNNVWEGGFKGALIGAATGALGGYLKHEAFDNAIHKNLIAQTGPGDDGVMMRYLGNNTFASPTALDAALVIGSRYSPYVSVAQKSWQLGQLIGNNIELFASSIANILISMGVNERVLIDPNIRNSRVYMAQHGKNNGKLTSEELEVLKQKKENGTLSNLEKQKLRLRF